MMHIVKPLQVRNVADVIHRILEIPVISDWQVIKRMGILLEFLFNVLS